MASPAQSSFRIADVPFEQSLELETSLTYQAGRGKTVSQIQPCDSRLPGRPQFRLSSTGDSNLVNSLGQDFCASNLDKLSPYLGLVATQSSTHITPLHGQLVRGRSIVLSENPELHLVWIGERIFIKPLPRFLLSWAFWKGFLVETPPGFDSERREFLIRSILGFMRTYRLLIQYESDFRIAQEMGLLPSSVDDFTRFIDFISSFKNIPDALVCRRYHFGELRLSRLNFWAKIFLHKWQFHKVHWAYGEYFAQFYGPLLFVFATLSLILNAMQVAVSATTPPPWEEFVKVTRRFSVVVLIFLLSACAALLALFTFMALREMIYASKDYIRKRKRQTSKVGV